MTKYAFLLTAAVALGGCQTESYESSASTLQPSSSRLTDDQARAEASLNCSVGNLEERTRLAYNHWASGLSKEKSREILSQGRSFAPGTVGEMELSIAVKRGFTSSSPDMAAIGAYSDCVNQNMASIRKLGR